MTGQATRQQVIDLARSWIGTPFLHQGRVPGHGLDCVGLVVVAAHRLKLFAHDYTDYSETPDGVTLERELGVVCTKLHPYQCRPGDLVLFWARPSSRAPQHVGMLTEVTSGNERIRCVLHTDRRVGRVVETPLTGSFANRVIAYYRYPNLID